MKRIRYGHWADAQEVLRRVARTHDANFTPEFRQSVVDMAFTQKLKDTFNELGYRASAESLEKLMNSLGNPTVSGDAIREHADDLVGRMVDELHRTMVFVLTIEEGARFEDAAPFGREVAEAFPSTAVDVEEATRCLVLGRCTASVFHCMRVMEIGLKTLGNRLAIPQRPNWETILKKAHGQMSLPNDKKDPDWIKDEAFLSDAIVMLTAVKTAWRNPTMHVEKMYTPEHAERIWQAVRGFMQQLATGLHE